MKSIPGDIIPQAAPRLSYLASKADIDAAVARTLENGRYILGPEVRQFEEEFAAFIGAPFGVAVASGTDALELSLRALGVGNGDRVLTVSHTAVATAAAIGRCGAVPVFIDIDPQTFTMDPNRLEEALHRFFDRRPAGEPEPKALIPVHLYGHPADMAPILEMAAKYELSVIEDCAQAHGAAIGGQRVGSFGEAGAFSFYPTKNLGAFGDGGFVTVRDPAVHERMTAMREYGWRQRYVSDIKGINTRLDEIQAAVLRVKLRKLAADNLRRAEIAGRFSRAVHAEWLCPPSVRDDGCTHAFHLYVVRSAFREALKTYLLRRGIGTAVHYPVPVHLQPAYAAAARGARGGLEHTEAACREILSLPLYPELREDQIGQICNALAEMTGKDLNA